MDSWNNLLWPLIGIQSDDMSQLALTGGPALAADLQSVAGSWPRVADAEALVREVLCSGRWCRLHPDSYAERKATQQQPAPIGVTPGMQG